MLLHNCTWAEAEQRMAKSPGIIIPIGSTEQHGPNGLIGTDAICADALAEAAGEKMDALVAPGIPVGMAQHHMAFKGSMTLRPSTLIQLIGDWVESLAQHGVTHFYFINAHGGNVATIKSAFEEVYAAEDLKGDNARQGDNARRIQCRSVNWWTGDRTTKVRQSLFGNKEGAHATPSEVSLTQYLRPNEIKNVAMEGDAGELTSYKDAGDFREKFPDGRMGSDPSVATPEDGKKILDACVEDIVEDYQKFLAGAA